MRIRTSPAALVPQAYVALIVWLALPGLTAAQQVTAIIEDGKRVYINVPSPKPRSTATSARPASKPAGGLQLASYRAPSAAARTESTGPGYSKEDLKQLASEAGERNQIDPALVHAIVQQESSWNPRAVSIKGALGLMQLMPGTAQDLGVTDAFDPEQNLDAGTRYLRALLERYDGNLDFALAAYNAGGGAVERAGGVPNYRETRNYIERITNAYFAPGSGRIPGWWRQSRKIYRITDETGKRIFTNE